MFTIEEKRISRNKANRKYRAKNREKFRELDKEAHKKYRATHREKCLAGSIKNNRQRKYKVLSAYSKNGIPECFCCGEKEMDFLCIDHPNNDGKKHRKDLQVFGSGAGFYGYLIRNNFPKTVQLQTACYNCNNSRKISGQCVHKKNE
jgi:hypothetical protein